LNKGLLGKVSFISLVFLSIVLILLIFGLPVYAALESGNVTLVSPSSSSYQKGTILINVTSATDNINASFYFSNNSNNFLYSVGNANTSCGGKICTISWNTSSGVVDGVYNITANATNTTDWTYNVTKTNTFITIDNTNPVINSVVPANNSFFNDPSTRLFNVTLTEINKDNSINVTVYYRRQGIGSYLSATLKCYGSSSPYTCNKTIDLATEIGLGNTNITQYFFNTTDLAGNTGSNASESNPLIATVDTVAPTSVTTLQHTDDAPTGYDNDTILMFNWSAASDTTSGIQKYRIYVSTNSSTFTSTADNDTATGYALTGSNGNTYAINVTSVDNANNENTTGTVSSTITVDTAKPAVTDAAVNDSVLRTTAGLQVNVTVTDNNINASNINVTGDSGTTFVSMSQVALSDVFSVGTTPSSLGCSGSSCTLTFYATDKAGNLNNTVTIGITTDNTTPASFSFVIPTEADNANKSQNWYYVNVTFTEANPDQCFVDDGSTNTSMTRSGTDFCYKNMTSQSDGTYTYKIYMNDTAENWGSSSTRTVHLDTAKPSVTANPTTYASGKIKATNGDTVTLNATVTDLGTGINTVTVVTTSLGCSSPLTLTRQGVTNFYTGNCTLDGASTGTASPTVTATDYASNSNNSVTLTVEIDADSPAIDLTHPSDGAYLKGSWFNITGTATDDNTDAVVTNDTHFTTRTGTYANWNFTNTSALTDGFYAVKITANDTAGNSNYSIANFTIDNTNPVINNTVPANNSYFNDPSTRLFQAVLTETNKDNSINATVYYRKQGIGSYTSATLKCYGSSSPYTCNKTINIGSLVGNGEVLQYFFNTTDLAGNTGSNGTQTSPLIATVDTVAPTYASNSTNATIIAVGDPVLIYAQWSDTYALSKAWLWTNETGGDGVNYTANYSSPATLSGISYWSNFTWKNASIASGTVLSWKIYANDTAGNENVTAAGTFVIDSTSPTWTINTTSIDNNTAYLAGRNYGFQINWTDNVAVSDVVLQFGGSNYTYLGNQINKSGSSTYYYNLTNLAAGSYTFKWYANDTSNNWNTSDSWTYVIAKATPTLSLIISPSNTTAYPTATTATGSVTTGDAIGSYNISLYRNDTIFNTSTSSSSVNEVITLATSIHNYTLVYNGTQNFTSASVENITNITKGTLSLSISGSNVSYSNAVSITATRGNNAVDNDVNYTLWRNDTMVATGNGTSGNLSDTSQLAAGWYVYTYNATGGTNWTANSSGVTLSINVSKKTLTLSINDSQTVYYPTSTTVTPTESNSGDADVNYTLYRNSTGFINSSTTNGTAPTAETVTLGYGVYTYTFNTTAGPFANYTANTTGITTTVTVNKGPTAITMYLNGSALTSKTYNKTQVANFTAVLNVSVKNVSLSTNITGWGSDISSTDSSSALINITTLNTSGVFNVTGYFAGDANYSASSNTTYITVNDVGYPVWSSNATNLTNNTNYSYTDPYQFNITWTDDTGIDDVILQFNNTNYSYKSSQIIKSGNVYYKTFSSQAAGSYTFKWYANDTSNNWNTSDSWTYVIAKAKTLTRLWINGTEANSEYEQGSTTLNFTATVNTSYSSTIYLHTNITGWGSDKSSDTSSITNLTSSSGFSGYWFNITAYFLGDANYSESSQIYWLNVTQDNTGPTVLLYDYTNGTIRKSNSNLTLNISISDSGAGITGSKCYININGSAGNISSSSGWCNGTITIPSNIGPDGNKTINITVNDSLNNTGFNSSYVLTLDNTAPTLSIITPTSGQYKKGIPWINGTVYDVIGMGVGNITTNNSNFVVYSFSGANTTAFNVSNNTAVLDGYIALTLYYNDSANNTGSASIAFYIDNTAPTTFTALTTGTKPRNSTQTVQVNVTDNLMTNATITLHYKRGGLIDWATETMTGTPAALTTYSVNIDTSMLADGEIVYYYVSGTDNATNSFSNGSATAPLGYFTIGDTTPPMQPTNLAAVQVGSTRQVNITWTASTSSDATGYYVYRDTGAVTTSSTNLGEAGNTTKFTDTVPADGTWNYTVIAHDAVPNVNTTITANATVTVTTTDTTPPMQPTNLAAVQVGSTKQINLTWSASTSSDAVRYNVYYKSSGSVTTSDNPFSIGNVTKASIAVGYDGNWNFTVTAIDSSNNENTTIVTSVNITIDTTAPGVSSTSPNGTITDNTPTLVVNTTEAGYCKLDDSDVSMSSMAYTMTGSGTGHAYTLGTLIDKVYTYSIYFLIFFVESIYSVYRCRRNQFFYKILKAWRFL
jgi:hypothetical protein